MYQRIVHGRNKQHRSLTLSNLKLKPSDEASQHLGLTLMGEMNYSLDLDLMGKCRLVERKLLLHLEWEHLKCDCT